MDKVENEGVTCQCHVDSLIPHIDHVWDWYIQFICANCGRVYFCECFHTAFKIEYQNALNNLNNYSERGWPYAFIEKYKNSTFREGICHLCRDIPSDLFYCHPMYGSKVMVHYGPYIMRTQIENGISQHEAENIVRDRLGIPRINEGWISEVELLSMVKNLFPNKQVIHQASPEWLGKQRLDIFMPELKIAIEYQGLQHYQPISHFGGIEGLEKTKERDLHKANLCSQNGITLIYFRYNEKLNSKLISDKINKIINKNV